LLCVYNIEYLFVCQGSSEQIFDVFYANLCVFYYFYLVLWALHKQRQGLRSILRCFADPALIRVTLTRCLPYVANLIYKFSSILRKSRAEASLGILQSPLGDRHTEPTLTPSGIQLLLNCWLKNLL